MQTKFLSRLFGLMFVLSLIACRSEGPANGDQAEDPQLSHQSAAPAQSVAFEIKPPLKNIDLAFQEFRVDPKTAETIELESGSSIEIPANAFVTKTGEPVESPVTITYREIRTPAEIIASGIPMHLRNEAGEVEWMQTAGMFEIKGFAGGEEVFIAEGSSLAVNMTSGVDGVYDFWYLDSEQSNWVQQGSANAAPNPGRAVAGAGRPGRAKPVKPIAFDKSRLSLNFDLSYDAFPELKEQRGIVWQYAGKDEKQDPKNNNWIFNEPWSDIQLERTETAGVYRMTLTSDRKSYSVPVHPSQKELDYKTSMEKYQRELAAYQARLDMQQVRRQQGEFLRSMGVDRFGIYNYDIMWKVQEAVPLVADFNFGDLPAEIKEQMTVYLITGDRRAVISYPSYDWSKFRFDPAQDNRLIAFLPGNRIATFSQQDFNEQLEAMKAAGGRVYEFRMVISDQPAESLAQVDQAIL